MMLECNVKIFELKIIYTNLVIFIVLMWDFQINIPPSQKKIGSYLKILFFKQIMTIDEKWIFYNNMECKWQENPLIISKVHLCLSETVDIGGSEMSPPLWASYGKADNWFKQVWLWIRSSEGMNQRKSSGQDYRKWQYSFRKC